MRATVRFINHARGMVAALTNDRSYSVFELLGGNSVEVGGELEGSHASGW